MSQQSDPVSAPAHYVEGKALGIETIAVIENELTKEEFRGYLKGSAIKYICRLGRKGSAKEDAGKATQMLERLIKTLEK